MKLVLLVSDPEDAIPVMEVEIREEKADAVHAAEEVDVLLAVVRVYIGALLYHGLFIRVQTPIIVKEKIADK